MTGKEGSHGTEEGWRGRFFEDFEVGDIYQHLRKGVSGIIDAPHLEELIADVLAHEDHEEQEVRLGRFRKEDPLRKLKTLS